MSFRVLPHFRLPSDPVLTQEALRAEPSVQIVFEEGAEFLRLLISSPAQIASVKFNGSEQRGPTVSEPASKIQFTMDELEAGFDRAQPLTLDVLGMNGKSRVVGNVWRMFSDVSFIRVPGTSIVLQKRSIISPKLERLKDGSSDERKDNLDWAVLLNEKGKDGKCESV